MALTSYQIGSILASCAGAILLTAILTLLFLHPVRRFTFSRNPKTTTEDVECQRASLACHFETIGHLVLSPDRRPLPSALDIINRVAIAIVLPAGTKPVIAKRGGEVGRIGKRHDAARKTGKERQDSVLRRGDAKEERDGMAGIEMEQLEKVQKVFVIGHDDDDEFENDDSAVPGPGSGKSMAALYHAASIRSGKRNVT
jgi:hypothetical protein